MTRHQRVAFVSLALGVAAVVGYAATHRMARGQDDFLLGGWFDSTRAALACAALGTVALVVGVIAALSSPAMGHRSRVVRTASGTGAFLLVVALLVVGGATTFWSFLTLRAFTVVEGTGGHDLVVAERAMLLLMSGVVYERDGDSLHRVASFQADDGYLPFLDGAYRVVSVSDDEVVLSYNFGEGPPFWRELVVPLGD